MTKISSNKYQKSLLQDALDWGIVNLDSVQEMLMSNKIERIKKIHPLLKMADVI